MTASTRSRALAFLLDAHELLPEEAAEALAVAGPVLADALKRLARHEKTHNPAACAEAAHALKGNLLNLGLDDLAHIADKLCAQARQGRLDNAGQAILTLALALGPLLP